MPGLQEFIHQLEEGSGARYIKMAAIALGFIALAALYDLREYRNFMAPEAMESAALARNLAEGRGFVTDAIRPFSLYLVQTHRADQSPLLKEGHPDLSNPPVYPLLLAGLMKILPFKYDIAEGEQFGRYQPELIIALLNQALFFVILIQQFFIARKLFDTGVAWLSSVILAGCDLFWHFSISGLPTLFLVALFLSLVWILIQVEQAVREHTMTPNRFYIWIGLIGLILGIGCLTRYSFGWLLIPTGGFLLLYGGPKRWIMVVPILVLFALIISPWLIRNYQICGAAFGLPGYAFFQDTTYFMGASLERSIHPPLDHLADFGIDEYIRKLVVNSGDILQNEIPALGGSWISAFFLVGLFVIFRKKTIVRTRILLLLNMLALIIVQAWGKTHLSEKTPHFNSENLLVLVVPLVFIYGSGLVFVLLDNLQLPSFIWRRWILGLTGFLCCLPLVFTFLPPRVYPLAYPPYWPWLIQKIGSFYDNSELIMSDAPWALAWYGRQQCLLTSLNLKPDFYEINDFIKPIKGLYLTQVTLDERFLSRWVRGENRSWGRFVTESIVGGNVPTEFPLRRAWTDPLPDQILLSDWERWKAIPRPVAK